jgi:hypothetical protein
MVGLLSVPVSGTAVEAGHFILSDQVQDGPFKGRDPRELCREAIEFWRAYLNEVDSADGQSEAKP